MKQLNKLFAIAVLLSVLICIYPLLQPVAQAAAEEKKGPPLDEIIWTVETEQEIGLKKVVAGDIDIFMWSMPWKVYEGLSPEDLAKITTIKCSTGIWCIEMNWAGCTEPTVAYPLNETAYPGIVIVSGGEGQPYRDDGVYFNPFALREVRYALNWLINREKIVEVALHGSGAPMFSAVQPSHPANSTFWPIYEEYGLTAEGDPAKSAEMVKEALLNVIDTWKAMGAPYDLRGGLLKDVKGGGDWLEFYDGTQWKLVELNFFMRIEDERHEEGLTVASWIEDYWKIKVERFEYDRTVCIPVVYGTDPLAYKWDLYTAGWVSMAEWPYPGDDLMWYYWLCPFLGYPYGAVNSSVWMTGLRLYLGAYETADEYWDLCKQLCRYGIWEAYRVFVAECWEFFAVNKERVSNIAFGRMTGLWNPWPLRTANTPDGKMRVAEYSAMGSLFMSAWNPVLGFTCVYSEVMWRYLHDYGAITNPETGIYMPVRATWKVEKDCYFDRETMTWVGRMDVPSDAIIYNHTLHKWVTVGTGQKASVKVVVNYKFSNWHHGIPMDISDVLATIGFYWEWAYKDPGEDVNYFYHPDIDWYYGDVFPLIKGIRIINDTALEMYGDYLFVVDDNVTAAFYIWWPVIPWEVRTVMEYCVVYGGPSTGKTYGWSEEYATYGRDEWIDMINPMHVADFDFAADQINKTEMAGWFRPNYTDLSGTPYYGYTPDRAACHARWTALLNWIDKYSHICVSNGPFYMEKWDPVKRYMVMKAFRDPTYPFTPDHWVKTLPPDYIANPAKVAPPPPPPPPRRIGIWVGVGVGIAVVVIAAVAALVLRKRA